MQLAACEVSFWKQAYIAALKRDSVLTTEQAAKLADASVTEFRLRRRG